MNKPQPTDDTLSDQTISNDPHSTEQWENRGTSDAYGSNAGNAPPPTEPVPGEGRMREAAGTEYGGDRARDAVQREGAHDDSAPKQAASIAGMATGMFFTVVIIAIVAVALILWLVL